MIKLLIKHWTAYGTILLCCHWGIEGERQEWGKKCYMKWRWPREKGPRLHSITWLDHVMSTHNEQHCLFKWPSIRIERFVHPCARTAVRFLFIIFLFHGRGRDKAKYTGESADWVNRSCQLIRTSQWGDGWPFIRRAVSGWKTKGYKWKMVSLSC